MGKNTENTILKKLKNDLILKHSSNMLKFWLLPPGFDLTRLWSQSGYIYFRCYLHQLKGIKNTDQTAPSENTPISVTINTNIHSLLDEITLKSVSAEGDYLETFDEITDLGLSSGSMLFLQEKFEKLFHLFDNIIAPNSTVSWLLSG